MAQTKKAQIENSQQHKNEQENNQNQIDLKANDKTQTPPSRQAGANQPQHSQYLKRSKQSEQNRGLSRGGQNSVRSPFSLISRFSEEMDRLFNDFGGGFNQMTLNDFSPQTEIFERGDELVVHADLPGMSKDDISVDIEDDQIVIRGERRNEREHNDEGVYHTERSYGSFYRAIPLPEGIDAEQAKADFSNGVLEITLPKPPQKSKGRSLEIGEGNQPTKQSNKKKDSGQ